MSRSLLKLSFLGLAAVLVSSCGEKSPDELNLPHEGLFATLESPIIDGSDGTKALSSSMSFYFAEGEKISVYPPSPAKSYMVYSLIPDASNPKNAKVDVDYFRLENTTYSAVYPAIMSDPEAVVSFENQSQSADGSTAHLTAYDYSWAATEFLNNSGNFAFKHKVSWLMMTVQAPDAATLKYIVVSADEGVAHTASFNTNTGEFNPIRSKGDELVLTLGGYKGINVAAGGKIVAYITIPPAKYTNLTMTAEDAEGHKYQYVFNGEIEVAARDCYARTLTRTDIPETTAFTRQSSLGMYGETNGEYPLSMIQYDDAHQQMSYGKGNDYRTFKLADLDQNIYAIFTISPKDMAIGEMYTVSADVNGTETQSNCKCVNVVGNCVWLEDKTTHVGYVINIE